MKSLSIRGLGTFWKTALRTRRHLLGGILAALLAPGAGEALTPPPGSIVLAERFQVSATWRTADGTTGRGTGVALTPETGYFWFFSPTNSEVVVKVLDACAGPSNRFWVFAGGLTDVEVEINVTDILTGEGKTYRNPQGTPFQPIQDTNAFATCGVAPRCGQATIFELAATPRVDWELEYLALFMSDQVTAPQTVYDRVVADVAALKTAEPGTWVNFVPPYSAEDLIVSLTPEAALAVRAGTYDAWDCLNDWYGVERVDPLSSESVVLRFRGRLDMTRIKVDYAALPGVVRADLNYYGMVATPLPGTASLCGWAEGDTFYYFLRHPAPSRYYTSAPGQTPVARGPLSANPAIQALASRCYEEHSMGGSI